MCTLNANVDGLVYEIQVRLLKAVHTSPRHGVQHCKITEGEGIAGSITTYLSPLQLLWKLI